MIIVQAGETALQIACSCGNLDVVEQLESCTEVSKKGQRRERYDISMLMYRLSWMLILHSPVHQGSGDR